MNTSEVKKILNGYAELETRAKAVLTAGDKRVEYISSVCLDDDEIGINYDVGRGGYTFHEYEHVPIEFFADGTDLKAEWAMLKAEREKNWKRMEAAARRADARAEKKRELAELKRLKAKYPGV